MEPREVRWKYEKKKRKSEPQINLADATARGDISGTPSC
jgi:hypothetical protein